MKKVLFILSAALFMASCQSVDIVKRKYSGGYYVNLKKEHPSTEDNRKTPEVNNNSITGIVHQHVKSTPVVPSPVVRSSATPLTAQKKLTIAAKAKPIAKEEQQIKTDITSNNHSLNTPKPTPPAEGGGDLSQVVMIILALLIPPLAIWLKEGITQRFWIDLICYLLGGGLVFTPYFYGGALMLFAIIFALLIVLDMI